MSKRTISETEKNVQNPTITYETSLRHIQDIAPHTSKQNSNSVKDGNKKKRSKQKHQAIRGNLVPAQTNELVKLVNY